MTILLTGATGYIGSHLWAELLKKSHSVIGLDNLSNSKIEVLSAIEQLSNHQPEFINGDIRNIQLIEDIFSRKKISHVIHLAGLKDVRQSMTEQEEYFDVNVKGLKSLLKVMRRHNCFKIIFSSSAAVYGLDAVSPIKEENHTIPSSFYGDTKLAGEQLLCDEFNKERAVSSVSLRYFNVAGRHASKLLPGDSSFRSHSLFSEIYKVLHGEKEALNIFGDDWETKDGTCIRDYLHVEDVVQGHIDSIALLNKQEGKYIINLGLGIGQSVLEVISACEKLSGRIISTRIVKKRKGDIGISFADTNLAKKIINWHPEKTLLDICGDSI